MFKETKKNSPLQLQPLKLFQLNEYLGQSPKNKKHCIVIQHNTTQTELNIKMTQLNRLLTTRVSMSASIFLVICRLV